MWPCDLTHHIFCLPPPLLQLLHSSPPKNWAHTLWFTYENVFFWLCCSLYECQGLTQNWHICSPLVINIWKNTNTCRMYVFRLHLYENSRIAAFRGNTGSVLLSESADKWVRHGWAEIRTYLWQIYHKLSSIYTFLASWCQPAQFMVLPFAFLWAGMSLQSIYRDAKLRVPSLSKIASACHLILVEFLLWYMLQSSSKYWAQQDEICTLHRRKWK